MGLRRVLQGECLSSIASVEGFAPSTLWDHPENARLKETRNPNALFPGDEIFVPEKRLRTERRPTGARHVFRRKAATTRLQVRLVADGEPRKNEAYVLDMAGAHKQGMTDGDGWIREPIPATATRAILTLRGGDETYTLQLGHLDPLEEISGVKARLTNLGFYAGAVDAQEDDALEEALAGFQEVYGLGVTGRVDDATRAKLREAHGT
jgi:hypothetical protein